MLLVFCPIPDRSPDEEKAFNYAHWLDNPAEYCGMQYCCIAGERKILRALEKHVQDRYNSIKDAIQQSHGSVKTKEAEFQEFKGTNSTRNDCYHERKAKFMATVFAANPYASRDLSGVDLMYYEDVKSRVDVFVGLYRVLCIEGETVRGGREHPSSYRTLEKVTLDAMNKRMFVFRDEKDIKKVLTASDKNRNSDSFQSKSSQQAKKGRKKGKRAEKSALAAEREKQAKRLKTAGQDHGGTTTSAVTVSSPSSDSESQSNWVPISLAHLWVWYLAVAMMKPSHKMSSHFDSLEDLLDSAHDRAALEKIVLVRSHQSMYYDFVGLRNCPHGGMFDVGKLMVKCYQECGKSLVCFGPGMSVVGVSYNVLYPKTKEYMQQYAQGRMAKFEPAKLLEGFCAFIGSKEVDASKAKELLSRDTLQVSIGFGNHSYKGRTVEGSGSFAYIDISGRTIAWDMLRRLWRRFRAI